MLTVTKKRAGVTTLRQNTTKTKLVTRTKKGMFS